MLYRQGDVLIEKIKELPKELKPAKRDNGKIVLAYGEVTGHSHSILEMEEKANSFVNDAGELFLSIKSDCQVVHEEHSAVSLPKGNYRVIHQREYSPEEIRNVRD